MVMTTWGPFSWKRMEEGIEQIRRCLERTATALSQAEDPYIVVSNNAVAGWVEDRYRRGPQHPEG